MAIQVQHRRGTAAAHSGFVGAPGELTWITDEKRWVGHDGATTGGIKVARLDEVSSEVLRAVGNTNFSFQITDRMVVSNTAFTAPRTGTLPAANAVSAGRTITFFDTLPAINGANTLTIARAGSDTINGATSLVCSTPGGRWDLVSDGVSRWSVTSFILDGDRGDIVASGSGATLTIDPAVLSAFGRTLVDDADAAAARATLSALGLAQSGLRNLIINGDFRFNQRAYGGSAVGAGVYTFDRWKAGASGVTFTASGGNATISAGSLVQIIEGASIAYGGTYVINWVGNATCTVDGVAKTKGETFTLTQGTNCTVAFSGGSVGSVQVEFGVIPTAFEIRPYGLELMLCQRYYVRFGETGRFTVGSGMSTSSLTCLAFVPLPVPMRAIPVLSLSSVAQIAADSAGGTGATTAVAITGTSPAGRSGIDLIITTSGSYAVPTGVIVRISANHWIAFDAEL
ncbi:hypothetical protein SAMN04515666_11911 [Bosea lupini]|uniref:Major tropism determinant N-terminal domain-containing protein n=1 Tax=Bosea lupini TaxID=1036779 RepID=A0A1H8ACT3_9HYPH|nr:hypothetical protein [Bosea lupini]SEM68585.1 hypothetical protein SAMN04515666_11911 [Bosea lupini]